MEKPREELTEAQLKLRIAAEEMSCRGHPPERPERPMWANSAVVYLVKEDAEEIQIAIKQWEQTSKNNELKSKHILVSASLMQPLKEALEAKPGGSGRQAFQIRRAGDISSQEEIKFKTYRAEELRRIRDEGGDPVECVPMEEVPAASREPEAAAGSGTTYGYGVFVGSRRPDSSGKAWADYRRGGGAGAGGLPHGDSGRWHGWQDWRWSSWHAWWGWSSWDGTRWTNEPWEGQQESHALGAEERQPPVAPPPPRQPVVAEEEIQLLRLRAESITRLGALDVDLVEFLTAPISVQNMSPELWLLVWEQVCTENVWLEMRDTPYCKVCGRAGIVASHLLTKECMDAREARKLAPGPLLKEILHAADR